MIKNNNKSVASLQIRITIRYLFTNLNSQCPLVKKNQALNIQQNNPIKYFAQLNHTKPHKVRGLSRKLTLFRLHG